jgi:O-antigen/teichoic acid export membrane protein
MLFAGDMLAKLLSFFAFIYLARTLGVDTYGILEFAVAIVPYLQLLADGGMDLWATREVARGRAVEYLIGRVLSVRLLLAVCGLALLMLLLPFFPDYPQFHTLIFLYCLILLSEAIDLKWIFMGQEKMPQVAKGLVTAQITFSVLVFVCIRKPEDVLWVPVFQFLGNLAMTGLLYRQLRASRPDMKVRLTLRGAREMLLPAFTLGASKGLGLLNFNFDTLLLGFMTTATQVGLYGAAYRPVGAFLAAITTIFQGLFTMLSRAHGESAGDFDRMITRSLHLSAVIAVPVGVGGTFLAGPVIALLYGDEFRDSVPVLQIICWSAAIIMLRGPLRLSLCAADHQQLDLRSAIIGTFINVGLNLVLIPAYGMIGAAMATVCADVIWYAISAWYFSVHIRRLRLLEFLLRPVFAGGIMSLVFILMGSWHWLLQTVVACMVYFITLFITGERSFLAGPRHVEHDSI